MDINEPVAWMNSKGDIILPAHQANKEYNIPLYTHPHSDKSVKEKTLTDEEIWELSDMVLNNSDVIGFARAILRKAQEK